MALVGNTHIISGGKEKIPLLVSLLEKEGIEMKGNPDVYIREYQRFGIEEARELRERASLRAVGKERVFTVVTSGMTNEAQNALLKTLEEPLGGALFFLIVPSPGTLLATLRSRAQILALSPGEKEQNLVDAREFLAASPKLRLDMLKPLLEKDDDDKRDISAIISFLSALESSLSVHVQKTSPDGVEAVYRARKYMGDKGALVKPLLEQVALLVPQT